MSDREGRASAREGVLAAHRRTRSEQTGWSFRKTDGEKERAGATRTAEDGSDRTRTDEEGGGRRGARQSERVKAMDETGTDGEWERHGRERGASQNAGSFNMADAS